MTGSDLDHFECPRCGASDRMRHLFLYLETIGFPERFRGARILHFAPERPLVRCITAHEPGRYVRADIAPASSEIEAVDMTAMTFPDASFDVVIANHVLEHVDDLPAAMREVARVLAPGGVAILQTPFSASLTQRFEDDGIRTDEARLVMYGQEDHVRLFGADIAEDLARLSGMNSRVLRHDEALPGVDPWRVGVNRDEPFFLFEKVS
ncbi:class I SAM-dependent methyltransferase [Luteibacter aegosomaticola]|uniref:class I SAM-dependent methyltransferase n=1 Tax=Luteibacter aegosomaticola TaxID=2911538 RepID=UPI001FF7DA99|nr:class I SAM-dependent methyltransferase [Luteibacter aegosomaticola]UPG91437.1 class I SAM-dependent methyltransferase [Luteibacter aegosomaticola]